MGLREDKKRRTRQRILELARKSFREVGYGATTVQHLAQAAEISEPTLFNYFPSKQAILTALGGEWLDAVSRATEHEVEASAAMPDRDALLRFFRQNSLERARAIEADAHFMALLYSRGAFTPDSEGVRTTHERLRDGFAFGQQAGALRADVPPADLADAYLASFNAAVMRWLGEPQGTRGCLETRVERIVELFLFGAVSTAD